RRRLRARVSPPSVPLERTAFLYEDKIAPRETICQYITDRAAPAFASLRCPDSALFGCTARAQSRVPSHLPTTCSTFRHSGPTSRSHTGPVRFPAFSCAPSGPRVPTYGPSHRVDSLLT